MELDVLVYSFSPSVLLSLSLTLKTNLPSVRSPVWSTVFPRDALPDSSELLLPSGPGTFLGQIPHFCLIFISVSFISPLRKVSSFLDLTSSFFLVYLFCWAHSNKVFCPPSVNEQFNTCKHACLSAWCCPSLNGFRFLWWTSFYHFTFTAFLHCVLSGLCLLARSSRLLLLIIIYM